VSVGKVWNVYCSGQGVSNNARFSEPRAQTNWRYLCSGVQLEESEIFSGHSLRCRTELRLRLWPERRRQKR